MATPRQWRRRRRFSLFALTVVGALVVAAVAFGAVTTDKQDYTPGSIVTISGDNSNGVGYVPGNPVGVAVSGGVDWSDSCSATVASNGTWSCKVTLSSDPAVAVGSYTYTATSTAEDGSTISESGTFTDAVQTATTVTSSSPQNTSTVGESVTFTATVKSGNPATNTVTNGQVKFGTGNNCAGDFSQLQAAANVDSNGHVTYTTTSLPQGTTTIRACYLGYGSGSTALQTSDGTVTQTVNPAGPSNTAPTVNWDGTQPSSAAEGDTKTFTFTITDTEGGSFQFVTGFPDCGSGNTLGSHSISGTTGSFQCTFVDGLVPAVNSTVRVQVQDSGPLTSNIATTNVLVSNANPVVAAPSFSPSPVGCRVSTSLTGISFSDAGLIDYPWTLNIAWDDGSSDYTDANVLTQGLYASQSHTYNAPGSYTATVGVTDKDGGYGSKTAAVMVLQTYTVAFLQPLDGAVPSRLISNTMKNGRVVPVKATVYDDCAQSYITGSSGNAVTIKLLTANFTASPGATDPVETYSDAGASSGNTTSFRWVTDGTVAGGGFWIYNLDSSGKGFGLTTGKTYEVHVVVDTVTQNNTYALLTPTK